MKKNAASTATLVGVAMTLLLAGISGCTASASAGASGDSGSCNANTSLSCVTGTTGWSCTGSAEPEDTNTDLICSGDGAGNFCCSTTTCTFDTTVTCGSGASGYSCATGATAPDQSDATLVCSEPTTASNVDTYCCFTNTTTAAASTCEQDTTVTGCQPNANGTPSYGFSCTGSENPQVDFSSITCSTTGTSGTDEQGAPATLFCCVYN